jgi:hypothetical protein
MAYREDFEAGCKKEFVGPEPVPANKSWVPHISLVSREMWDATNLNVHAYRRTKFEGLVLWYPTSREKRARCGAPRILLQVEILQRSAAAGENFCQLLRSDHFELRVGTVARLLVRAPSAELRHVPETAALHVLVCNFYHQLRP